MHHRSAFTLTTGAWMNVVGVYNGSNLSIYINGSLSQGSLTGSIPTSPYTGSSALLIGDDGAPHKLSGLIDDVRIYNRALSAAQIAAMYAGGK